MKFSIIIPVYNVEKYLLECVNSILEQSYKSYEIILIDDGSTDKSGKLCDDLSSKNKKIKTYHKVNGGLSSARNEGIKYAKGKYIIFLDSDDYWDDKDALFKFDNILQKKDVEVLIFGVKKYYEDIDKFEKYKDKTETTDLVQMIRETTFKAQATNKIVRLDFIKKYNILFPLDMLSEDITWCAELIDKCDDFCFVNEGVYVYRQRKNSITHQKNIKHVSDILIQCKEGMEKYKNSSKKNVMYSFLAFEYCTAIYGSTVHNLKKNNELMQQIKSCKELLKYSLSKKARLINLANNLFGFHFMYYLLKIYYKIKTKKDGK